MMKLTASGLSHRSRYEGDEPVTEKLLTDGIKGTIFFDELTIMLFAHVSANCADNAINRTSTLIPKTGFVPQKFLHSERKHERILLRTPLHAPTRENLPSMKRKERSSINNDKSPDDEKISATLDLKAAIMSLVFERGQEKTC